MLRTADVKLTAEGEGPLRPERHPALSAPLTVAFLLAL